MKRISIGVLFSILLSCIVAVTPINSAQGGLLNCINPRKWSGYPKLRTAYFKDPQIKTQDDWFKSYIFARIYTGSAKCFKNKDVAVMNKWVNAYNQACANDPSWNFSCKLYSGSSTLSSWVYEGYK